MNLQLQLVSMRLLSISLLSIIISLLIGCTYPVQQRDNHSNVLILHDSLVQTYFYQLPSDVLWIDSQIIFNTYLEGVFALNFEKNMKRLLFTNDMLDRLMEKIKRNATNPINQEPVNNGEFRFKPTVYTSYSNLFLLNDSSILTSIYVNYSIVDSSGEDQYKFSNVYPCFVTFDYKEMKFISIASISKENNLYKDYPNFLSLNLSEEMEPVLGSLKIVPKSSYDSSYYYMYALFPDSSVLTHVKVYPTTNLHRYKQSSGLIKLNAPFLKNDSISLAYDKKGVYNIEYPTYLYACDSNEFIYNLSSNGFDRFLINVLVDKEVPEYITHWYTVNEDNVHLDNTTSSGDVVSHYYNEWDNSWIEMIKRDSIILRKLFK